MPKRTFKQAAVPPLRREVSIGEIAPVFTAADVLAMRRLIGVSIRDNRSADNVAVAWSKAFSNAAVYLPFEVHTAPNELQDFYKGVDEAARALLKALGFSGNAALAIAEATARDGPPILAIEHLKKPLSWVGAEALPFHKDVAARVIVRKGRKGSLEPVNAALDVAPYSVALLALSARVGRMAYSAATPAKSGPKPGRFRPELFQALAAGFGYAFGQAPDTSKDRAEEDNTSTAWIGWIIRTAADRIEGCILHDVADEVQRTALASAHPLVKGVRRLAKRSNVTLANQLATAQRKLAARQPGEAEAVSAVEPF